MAEEESTQDQPESELPQDQDAADPRLVSRVVEGDERLVSWEEKAREPSEGEEAES